MSLGHVLLVFLIASGVSFVCQGVIAVIQFFVGRSRRRRFVRDANFRWRRRAQDGSVVFEVKSGYRVVDWEGVLLITQDGSVLGMGVGDMGKLLGWTRGVILENGPAPVAPATPPDRRQ